MSKNNPKEVQNFEQLMRKYIKDNEPIINKYDYQSPLREIAPLEPLIFQNDFFEQNNNPKNIQNFEPIYNNNNNDLNNIHPNILNQRNNLIDNFNNNANDNKFITPSKPNNNKNISIINSSIEREKEAKEEKKKKQLEYQKMLDEQIKEKKLRKKLEKEKRLQEELKFEEKLKLENEKYQQEINAIKNKNKYRNISNLFSGEEQIEKTNPMSSKNLILEENNNNLIVEKDMDENVQNEINNNNNGIKRTKSQPYFEVMNNNNIFEINKNQKYQMNNPYMGPEGMESQENPLFQNQNQNRNIPTQQIPIEHLVSTSSQLPPQFLNPQHNHLQPQYKTQNNYYPSNRNFQNQSQNCFQNLNSGNINYPPQSQPPQADLSPYLTQRQYYDYRQKLHRNPSSELGSNTNISINPSNYPTSYQIPFNNNLMNSSPNPVNFNNNSQNVNELLNMNINNQNNYFGKIMEIFFHEQEKIIESYKETIEKLKSERDEAIYKNKANEEKILALQKMQNDQEILEKNLGYYPLKNNYQQNMEKTLDSIMQKNEDINDNKKEDQSLNNNNSNISDSKLASLITSTKFVKVNPNNDTKHLLETWKKDEKLENENETEEKNKNNIKQFKFNGMDTNAFMEKINLINNKILEPQDEPLNYLNNNISIISKTQKNDDKSFANELSNRNDKIEISNINNDKEEINNNIRDSDLSTRKFVVELQSKDFVLNNVHNPIMQNLDNNVSYSTQIKERMEEKNKNITNKNIHKKIDVISEKEKESRLSHNFEDEEKKEKYQNYAFKQVKCSNSKNNMSNDSNINCINNNANDIKNIKFLPGLKNIDNNVTVSNSKKNYSLLLSRHTNPNDNNINNNNNILDKNKEKNPFENIISMNDEEDNINNNIKDIRKGNIEDKSQEIEEEINDLPNLDSPRNNNNKIGQTLDFEKDMNQNKNINDDNNIGMNANGNGNKNKGKDKKEEEIIDKLNFFEDDNNLSDKIRLNKKESKNNKYNNINLDINDSFLKEKEKNSNINNNKNNINEMSKHSNRPPSDLTGEKISSLNNLYDQFVKKKKDQLDETNNSVVNNNMNNMANNSLLNESLNTFTQNLNKKWKDLSKKDINNIKINREQHYNNDNTYDNNINNNFSYLDDDKYEDEKIFDKVNQFTRVALNELKQSQLSVFSKEKTMKKYE